MELLGQNKKITILNNTSQNENVSILKENEGVLMYFSYENLREWRKGQRPLNFNRYVFRLQRNY